MPVSGARDAITAELTAWPGVGARPHRFGGTEFVYGERREIGHIHGDQLVDIPLPTRLRDELVAAGHAQPHYILPETGWISFYLRHPDDVASAIELFRLSYDVAARQKTPDEPGQ
jgi:Family of unknown function (DUF5519)